MTAFELPATDAPASEWGRLAVSIPGWRCMPGMHDCWGRCAVSDAAGGVQWVNPYNPADQCEPDHWPDPDDPATAGCLLALLGRPVEVRLYRDAGVTRYPRVGCLLSEGRSRHASTLGRACIATAAVLGSWPGGSDTPSGQRAP